MSDTTQFTIGTEARCTDGVCGEVSRVVVDPVGQVVTHLVIEPKGRAGLARLVPVGLVEAASPEVRLRCTLDAFGHLDPAEETQFVPGSVGYAAYGPEQVIAWPYYGLNPGAGLPGGVDLGGPGSRRPSPTTVSPWARSRCGAATGWKPRTAVSGASRGWSLTLTIIRSRTCCCRRGTCGAAGMWPSPSRPCPGRGHHPAQDQQAGGPGPAASGLRPARRLARPARLARLVG